eukprot:s831_g12.t1
MLHIELLEEEVPLSGTVLTQQALQLTFSLEEDGLTHPNPRLANVLAQLHSHRGRHAPVSLLLLVEQLRVCRRLLQLVC